MLERAAQGGGLVGNISGRWTVGLDDLGGLFQPRWFCDSMILRLGWKSPLQKQWFNQWSVNRDWKERISCRHLPGVCFTSSEINLTSRISRPVGLWKRTRSTKAQNLRYWTEKKAQWNCRKLRNQKKNPNSDPDPNKNNWDPQLGINQLFCSGPKYSQKFAYPFNVVRPLVSARNNSLRP